MAKTSTKKEKYKNADNLRILQERLFKTTSDIPCSTLQKLTGVSDSSIKSITNGNRINPNIDNLISIAKGLDLSIDYLVGLSNSNTCKLDERDICEQTGLSEDSLRKIQFLTTFDEESKYIINSFFEYVNICSIMEKIKQFIYYQPTENNMNDFRTSEIEKIYLDRLNKEIIEFKNSLDITLVSLLALKENLKPQNNQMNRKRNKHYESKDLLDRISFLSEYVQRSHEIEKAIDSHKRSKESKKELEKFNISIKTSRALKNNDD